MDGAQYAVEQLFAAGGWFASDWPGLCRVSVRPIAVAAPPMKKARMMMIMDKPPPSLAAGTHAERNFSGA